MKRQYYVYIMTNKHNTVLYIGVTNDLSRRVYEHQQKRGGTFTARYNVTKRVYMETFPDIREAIAREKQIKGGSRRAKLELIKSINPQWKDLMAEG